MSDEHHAPLSHLLSKESITALTRSWFKEDMPNFDYDVFAVCEDVRTCRRAKLLIKSPGVVAGIPFFDAVFKEVDCSVVWSHGLREGDYFDCKNGVRIATIEGEFKNILKGERIALNCLSRSSGIATLTRKFVGQAQKQGWSGKVAATRKTTPGFRLVEKYAALVAGADTHRFNLSSMVMLKDNHIWSTGSISKAVAQVKKVSGHTLKIEVECQSLDDGLEAAKAGADVVMFDNFTPEELHNAAHSLKLSFPSVIVEASGGINEDSFALFCGPHVDIISTSRITQGYPVVDFSVEFMKSEEC